MTVSILIGSIVVGVGATLVQDLWNLLLKWVFGIPSLNLKLLGRWLCYMPAGKFSHANINAAEPKGPENFIGVFAHYSIGVAFSMILVLTTNGGWLARPTLVPALVISLVTLVFPFFFLQPALGLGFASSKAPNPSMARLKSVMSHVAFGIGLYLCALPVSYLPQIRPQ